MNDRSPRLLDRLLPPAIDNVFNGRRAALWLLALLSLIKTAMAVNSIVNGPVVLTSADGVPLASYPPDASQTIVALFALWAVAQLGFVFVAAVALLRYRRATPLVFLLFTAEHVLRKLVLRFLPIVRDRGAPASSVNAVLLALMLIGLVVSLLPASRSRVSN